MVLDTILPCSLCWAWIGVRIPIQLKSIHWVLPTWLRRVGMDQKIGPLFITCGYRDQDNWQSPVPYFLGGHAWLFMAFQFPQSGWVFFLLLLLLCTHIISDQSNLSWDFLQAWIDSRCQELKVAIIPMIKKIIQYQEAAQSGGFYICSVILIPWLKLTIFKG